MQSYEAANMATWIRNFGDLVNIIPSEKVKPGRSGAGRRDPVRARARLDEGSGGSRPPSSPDPAGEGRTPVRAAPVAGGRRRRGSGC